MSMMGRRGFLANARLTGIALMGQRKSRAQETGADACRFPAFATAGKGFRFVLVADPQVGHADDPNPVSANARRTLTLATAEQNGLSPQPLFVAYLGDLVNVFDEASVATFEGCIAGLKARPVLVHGNHDTRPPYEGFKALMRRVSGFDAVFYSFDAGDWHFIALPCNLGGDGEAAKRAEGDMLDWLEKDLAGNSRRPTMIFEHYHALPQGLTQLEWYNFPMTLRVKLMELFTRHGNVRWYFNGHVHNGLKASVKTSWRYKNINFVNTPTVIQSRNFGEEYAGFEQGLETGGYYLVVDVDGDEVKLTGRLAGTEMTFDYPGRFREFAEEIEPRWFVRAAALPGNKQLVNGDFSRGLEGWKSTYRYLSDESPGFGCSDEIKDGRPSARLFTRTKDPVFWANDESNELYQTIVAPSNGRGLLRTAYLLDSAPNNGGGYFRVSAMKGDEFRFMMMFRWGVAFERDVDIMVRSFAFGWHGEPKGWKYLQELGARKRAFYWVLPESPSIWHTVTADLPALYDAAMGAPGAFAQQGIDKYALGLGTWVTKAQGACSTAWFSGISFDEGVSESVVDGNALTTDASVFSCAFGQSLADREARKEERRKRKTETPQ